MFSGIDLMQIGIGIIFVACCFIGLVSFLEFYIPLGDWIYMRLGYKPKNLRGLGHSNRKPGYLTMQSYQDKNDSDTD